MLASLYNRCQKKNWTWKVKSGCHRTSPRPALTLYNSLWVLPNLCHPHNLENKIKPVESTPPPPNQVSCIQFKFNTYKAKKGVLTCLMFGQYKPNTLKYQKQVLQKFAKACFEPQQFIFGVCQTFAHLHFRKKVGLWRVSQHPLSIPFSLLAQYDTGQEACIYLWLMKFELNTRKVVR